MTNQSGIARGLYRQEDYEAVAQRLDELLAGEGIHLDDTHFCPHHPDFSGECACRKPATGMHREASEILGLDPTLSYFVGDKIPDLLPALELGGEGVLVRTGLWRTGGRSPTAGLCQVVDDLLAAARFILIPPEKYALPIRRVVSAPILHERKSRTDSGHLDPHGYPKIAW